MAEKKLTKVSYFNPEKALQDLFLKAAILKEKEKSKNNFFYSKGLSKLGNKLSAVNPDFISPGTYEYQRMKSSQEIRGNEIILGTLPEDIKRLSRNLKMLEENYLKHTASGREETLEDLVYHGQELLRRKYISKILHPGLKISCTRNFELIVEFGSAAIQILGKAPVKPKYAFQKFSANYKPSAKYTGIEILSSGAFPDWHDKTNLELKKKGKVRSAGFEIVLDAAFDTPRSRVIKNAMENNKLDNVFSLPLFLRTMLDLELMRLGQATTPGTFSMLLNSYYYGAMLVDHSTNVSEQVQIIYAEENWKPAFVLSAKLNIQKQVNNTISLLKDYFVTKNTSPVKRDHPRTARIEFDDTLDLTFVGKYFTDIKNNIKNGKLLINPRVHEILPVIRFKNCYKRSDYLRKIIPILINCGFNKAALIADYIKHYPGLLQYFENPAETNGIISFAKNRGFTLIDGRTVDMIATSNKAIEAAAGAIMSGHGCIKVGLLGLTYEQMSEFIDKFKKGLNSYFKRQDNQLIVFIGLVDEPVVSENEVYVNAKEISVKFVELMLKKKHDILLLDTMRKGKDDKRLVSEKDVNINDTKGGHLTFGELKSLVKMANKRIGRFPGCELWVAGSYTEGQVYQASLEPLESRPGLICLGGAERSFGGIRLEPKDAYEITSKKKSEKELAALIQFDSDIKFILSRDNKLARDAGLVEGELRRKKNKAAGELKSLRKKYMSARDEYFKSLSDLVKSRKLNIKNIDTLFNISDSFKNKENNLLKKTFLNIRSKYVETVANHMKILFNDKWLGDKH